VTLKGLSDSELFDLKRSIGNNYSGFEPHLKPLQVSKVLQKALDCENSTKDIAEFLELKTIASGRTMVTRTIRLFKKLHPNLHNSVVYKSHSSKDRVKKKSISFQSAVELSRFELDKQEEVFEEVVKNGFSKENIKTIIHYTKKAKLSLEESIEKLKTDKGVSEFQTIYKDIKLNELNKKIYSMKQLERNKVFKNICKQIFDSEVKEVHLGVFTLYVTFEKKGTIVKQIEMKDIHKQIEERIKKYG
tara:strand:+ start:1077 stop:1814 length:738 start_codon:yes stop_codon:yes gene_type:complete